VRAVDVAHRKEQRRKAAELARQRAGPTLPIRGGLSVVLYDAVGGSSASARNPGHRSEGDDIGRLAASALSLRHFVARRSSSRAFAQPAEFFLHTFGRTAGERQMLDRLHRVTRSWHESSSLAEQSALNCSWLRARLESRIGTPAFEASECRATWSGLLSLQRAVSLKRASELERAAPFAAVFIARLDLLWRAELPFGSWMSVAAARRSLVILPAHCAPQSPPEDADAETKWKRGWCGGQAFETLATQVASRCGAAAPRAGKRAAEAVRSSKKGTAGPTNGKHAPLSSDGRPRLSVVSAGTTGACDTRAVTYTGRSFFVLDWWLFFADSRLADRFALELAAHEPDRFAETSAIVSARLSARRPAPAAWLMPPQFISPGFFWGWALLRRHEQRLHATIAWAVRHIPDVHVVPVAQALATGVHRPCLPPERMLTAASVRAHESDGGEGGAMAALKLRQQRARTRPRDHKRAEELPAHTVPVPPRFDSKHPAAIARVDSAWDGRVDVRTRSIAAPSIQAASADSSLDSNASAFEAARQSGLVIAGEAGSSSEDHDSASNLMATSCSAGRHHFLCGPYSTACEAAASRASLRERSVFLRVLVERASEQWTMINGNGTRYADAIAEMWARPCLVLESSHCGAHGEHTRFSAAPKSVPVFTERTRQRARRRRATAIEAPARGSYDTPAGLGPARHGDSRLEL
jgi:hypothetical protein